jgi:hypothetical protein
MKHFFILSILFLASFKVQAATDWSEIYSQPTGSCETNNLNFTALRFTKIPLSKENLYLRIIVFVRSDNTQAIRTTTQELLGCQTASDGSELCSYRPIDNFWHEDHWHELPEGLDLGAAGTFAKLGENNYSMTLPKDFMYPEIAGKTFPGKMILVNFNDHGVNSANLCKSLQ